MQMANGGWRPDGCSDVVVDGRGSRSRGATSTKINNLHRNHGYTSNVLNKIQFSYLKIKLTIYSLSF